MLLQGNINAFCNVLGYSMLYTIMQNACNRTKLTLSSYASVCNTRLQAGILR